MASRFSPSASIDPQAEIGADVAIGPFCVIGPHVRIGHGSRLENHVTLSGNMTVGEYNHLFPGVVIGQPGGHQRDNVNGERIVIGDHNKIREGVTISPGLTSGTPTTIGNHNLVMACCHIGCSCCLGDQITIANGSILSRGARVNDYASLSGRVMVNEDVIVGSYSFTGISSHVFRDVPPFVIVEGVPSRPRSLNLVGLIRNGFSSDTIRALGIAYRLIFRAKLAVEQARVILDSAVIAEPRVDELLRYIATHEPEELRSSRDRRRETPSHTASKAARS